MARKEEDSSNRDGERDRDRSRKRKIAEDSNERNAANGEDNDSKRREKHRHKHHRKHKHRSHKKHKQEEADKADGGNEDSAVAVVEPAEQKISDETEDGEILEVEAAQVEAGQVEAENIEVPEKQVDGKDPSEELRETRRHGQQASSLDTPESAVGSRSTDRKARSRSPERKRRSASPERRRGETSVSPDRRDSLRDYAIGNYSRDRKRRSRSRDHREDTRRPYSPERRRRSKSRDYNDRDRYSRRRGESRERSYREDRLQQRDKDEKYQRDRTSIREGREDTRLDRNLETAREEDNQDKYLERVEHQLAEQEQEEDIEKVKEESRRRRQAILEKYKKQTEAVDVSKNNDVADERKEGTNSSDHQIKGVAPAVEAVEKVMKPPTTVSHTVSVLKTAGLGQGTPPKDEREERSDRSADMFCDIFGETPPEAHKMAKPEGRTLDTSGLTDNWDDAEGYYTYRIGEILDNRYEIASSHGKGVFSTVVRARDTKASRGDLEEIAIKIIRNNETMYKAGQRELIILKKLAGADPDNRRHCVRLLSSFEYRNHLCLVFESLHMNLREILKKFGRNIGISLKAVRSYALQLFTALKHLRNCGVLHCDIKPDNMLVNDSKNVLKLCDFGSAMFAGENEITPYLVSRFYRAPEIILGLPYDHALDMWSVGCCLYELYSGKVLFPGATNNDMLRLHMELKGPFPKKMLKKAGFANQHFDQDFNFLAIEEDPVSKKTMKRVLNIVKPKDISSLIPGNADEDPKLLANFKLLLEKMFMLDPEKRLTVSQALSHPFILGK